MTGVLQGIRVIDFGQYVAGPLAGMMLADQGADVVRVDPPGGPRWDTPANATRNRGKRSVVLDLKRADDLMIAQQLIETADVVVENFRPGVMERLSLGAQAMTETNPRLVYCSMPGFAPDEPRAGVRAWEGIVGAATWTYRPSPSGSDPKQPIYTAIPIASCYAAFISAVRIEELFKWRSAQEWEDLAAAVGSEVAICRSTAEWMAHPRAWESKMIIHVDDPKLGKMVQPGINARLASARGAVRRPAPQINSHRAEVLGELGLRVCVSKK